MALLWPDLDPVSARRTLNEATYVIRRDLGAEVVRTEADDLVLADAVPCDVIDFRLAIAQGDRRRAAAVYAGPLYGSAVPSGSPDFEQWIEQERDVLARRYRDVLASLGAEAVAAGDARAAGLWFERLVAEDPLTVVGVGGLAQALAARGEHAEAIRVLDAAALRWKEELGVDAPADLRRVRSEIHEARVSGRRISATTVVADLPADVPAPRVEHDVSTEPLEQAASTPVHEAYRGVAPVARTSAPVVRRHRRWWSVAAVAAVVALVSWRGGRLGRASPVARMVEHMPRLVIAPVDVGRDTTIATEARALAGQLAGYLGSFAGLTVVAPEAFSGPADPALDLGRLRRSLEAPLVIRLQMTVNGGEIRVVGRLLDAVDGEQLSSILVEVPRADPAALRTRVITETAVAVRKALGHADARAVYAAWEALGMVGPENLARTWLADRWRADVAALRLAGQLSPDVQARGRALARQADSVLAVAEDADSAWIEPVLQRAALAVDLARFESGPARIAEAGKGLASAERAVIRLEGLLAALPADASESVRLLRRLRQRQYALALHYRGWLRILADDAMATNRPETDGRRSGERDQERALQADPTLAPAWAVLAQYRWKRGVFDSAYVAAESAAVLDPYGRALEESINFAARAAAAAGDRATTMRWCERGLAAYPGSWRFRDCQLLVFGLDAAGQGKRPDSAAAWALIDTLEQLDSPAGAASAGRPYSPIYRRLAGAAVSAATGDAMRAKAELRRAEQAVGGRSDLEVDILVDRAFVYLVLGDTARARADLTAYGRARPDWAETVWRMARFRRLRSSPSSVTRPESTQ